MKIAMILDSLFPPDPRVENEALTLINAGHEVCVFCLTYSNEEPLKEKYKRIQVIRMKVPRAYRSISALAYTIPLYHYLLKRELSKVFDPLQYEAVHIHDIQSARSVFDIIEGEEMIKVLDLHENRPEIMKYYEHVNSLLGNLLISPPRWKSFEEHFIRQADRVIVVTPAAREYYLEWIHTQREKFKVVPNSVKKTFYEQPELKSSIIDRYKDRFVLLYLGDTGERRGISTVLESVKELHKELKDLVFVCVGNSKSDTQWQDYVNAHGLNAYVDLLGWQDFNLFPSFISASDICLSPLHRNIHHDTTFANKLFQYMSLKKPVLVSDSTAQAEVVQETGCGLVFEAENTQAFTEAVRTLYRNEEMRVGMGENGYQAIIETYNWEKVSHELVDLYNELEL